MLNLNVQGEIDRLEQTYLSNCRQGGLDVFRHIQTHSLDIFGIFDSSFSQEIKVEELLILGYLLSGGRSRMANPCYLG